MFMCIPIQFCEDFSFLETSLVSNFLLLLVSDANDDACNCGLMYATNNHL